MPTSPTTDPVDDVELTERELTFGYWFTTHQLQLRKAGIAALIVFDVLLGGYNIYKWMDYALSGYFDDERLAVEIARPRMDWANLRQHFAVQPIQIEETLALSAGAKTDLLAMLKNPNADFIVEFTPDFGTGPVQMGGASSSRRTVFLLPGEEKPVAELGAEGGAGGSLELRNIKWQRISHHLIKDTADYQAKRLNFSVSDFQFTPASAVGLGYNKVAFKVSNDTFFSYWQADFIAVLKMGSSIVGVENAALDNFNSAEQREVELAVDRGITPSDVTLFPNINVYDEKVYFK